MPRDAQQHRHSTAYTHYRPHQGNAARTFHVQRESRHSIKPKPKPTTKAPSTTTSIPFSPSPASPSLYYFKPHDSTISGGTSTSTPSYSQKGEENDNLAVPSHFTDPTYIVYPKSEERRAKTTSSPPQKYLKKPVYGYDAANSKSIYREETAKFHPAHSVHVQKVILTSDPSSTDIDNDE